MAHDVKTEGYGCVCVCGRVGGGGVKEYISRTTHFPPSPASIFKKPEHFSLVTSFDWSWQIVALSCCYSHKCEKH